MKKYLSVIAALVLAVTLVGCSGVQPESQPETITGSANFRLLLSDEPNEIASFYSLNVTVTSIGWQRESESDNVTLDPAVSIDLTKLVGDNATEIWNGHLTSGNYTHVFIYTSDVTGILWNSDKTGPGDNATVKLPSGKLQIYKPFTITDEGGSSLVNFVFDITVIKAGNSDKYILKPQIGESGPNQPFKDVTPPGERHGQDKDTNDTGQMRLEGTITTIGGSNSFEMQADSKTWTVNYSAARKIIGMPEGGLTVGLKVTVEGTSGGSNNITAKTVQIRKAK